MGKNKYRQHDEAMHEEDPQDVLIDEVPRRGFMKSAISVVLIVALLGSWWYGFGRSYGAIKSAAVSVTSGVASIFNLSGAGISEVVGDGELSTGGSDSFADASDSSSSSSWEIRKSMAGDTIWKAYAQDFTEQGDVVFQHQVINGLKNITVLKNSIGLDKVANNSMVLGREYSFLSKDMQEKFADKVTEANKKLQTGTHLKDLDSGLRLAYQLANAPSYQFVYSLQLSDVQQLLE